jgi:hypothetical protein
LRTTAWLDVGSSRTTEDLVAKRSANVTNVIESGTDDARIVAP